MLLLDYFCGISIAKTNTDHTVTGMPAALLHPQFIPIRVEG